jgi:hypothetical protein
VSLPFFCSRTIALRGGGVNGFYVESIKLSARDERTLTDWGPGRHHEPIDRDTSIAQKLAAILPYLNEKQRRLLLATEARSLGRGGISRVARASGVSCPNPTGRG